MWQKANAAAGTEIASVAPEKAAPEAVPEATPEATSPVPKTVTPEAPPAAAPAPKKVARTRPVPRRPSFGEMFFGFH
jgi:hypothetical protein